jgi:uncharacterized protein
MTRPTPDSAGATSLHRGFEPHPFKPAPWLPGPHLQTVGGKFLRPETRNGLVRNRIQTPDGDFLDLDLSPDLPLGGGPPLVLVLHGLEGNTARGYVRLAVQELARRGVAAAGLNFRSCSGEPNLQPRFYHSGETGDLAHVIEWLRDRYPRSPLGALGFSLGGNVLLKFLGESGDHEAARTLRAAVAVSVPFDLVAGTRALEGGAMGRVYTHYFLRSLREKTEAKADLLEGHVELEAVRRARTLREYDEAATAPLHGFSGARVYYERSSSALYLARVRVPTLLLQAEDDPFLPRDALPVDTVRMNPALLAGFTPAGGHVGFVGGPVPWRPTFWAEAEGARYLAHILTER